MTAPWPHSAPRSMPGAFQQAPNYGPGYNYPPPVLVARHKGPENGLGTGGFVVSLIGFLFALPLFMFFLSLPLLITGAALSFAGCQKADRGLATNQGLALTGGILAILGLAWQIGAILLGAAVS